MSGEAGSILGRGVLRSLTRNRSLLYASRLATVAAAVVPASALFASGSTSIGTIGQTVGQASTSVMSVPGSPEKSPAPLPPPKGVPVRVTVGPPTTLGDATAARSAVSKAEVNDRPGVRTAIIGSAAAGSAVVSVTPGSAQVLGDVNATTVIESAGLERSSDDPTLGGTAGGSVAWLLSRSSALIAASPTPTVEAAAVQVAAWKMTGAVNAATPTTSAAVNLRAADLVTAAAGRSLPSTIVVSAPSKACLDEVTRVSLQGPPNSPVSLTPTGPVVLLQDSLTLNASGAGTALVRPRRPGAIGIAASGQSSELVRLNTQLPSGAGDAEALRLLTLSAIRVTGAGSSSVVDCGSSGSPDDGVGVALSSGGGSGNGAGGASRLVTRQSGVDQSPGSANRPASVRGIAWVVVNWSRATDLDGSRRALNVRIRNVGGRPAKNLTITARVPGEGRILDPGGAEIGRRRIVTWHFASMKPGVSRTLTVVVEARGRRTGIPLRQIIVRGVNLLAQWERPLASPRGS